MEVEFVHFLLCVVHLLFGVLESFREDVEGIVVPSTGEVMACLLHKVFGFIDKMVVLVMVMPEVHLRNGLGWKNSWIITSFALIIIVGIRF